MSRRMGQPKLSLPFGSELMLPRVCRLLSEVVPRIVVVAAQDQELPRLPEFVSIARDEYASLGPLAGLATGLRAIRPEADVVYVPACDVPLLRPAFVRALLDRLGDADCAVPTDGRFDHVLSAVYRTHLEDRARQLLSEDRRRPLFLVEQSRSLRVPVEELRAADPDLDSLSNLNTPEDYETALARLRNQEPHS